MKKKPAVPKQLEHQLKQAPNAMELLYSLLGGTGETIELTPEKMLNVQKEIQDIQKNNLKKIGALAPLALAQSASKPIKRKK